MKFELYRDGGSEVLKELVADEIRALTEQIGRNAGDAAEVDHYVTDRAAGSVSVPAAQQAAHGTLTRAASSAGLEVKAKR